MNDNSKLSLGVSLFVLLLLFTLRDFSVGTDTATYLEMYNSMKTDVLVKGTEWGWFLINRMTYLFFDDFTFLLFFSGLLIVIPLYFAINNESNSKLLSVLFFIILYFYLNSFNIMRQAVAMSFALLAFSFIGKSKIKYVLLLLSASLFHTTALLLLPLYFIYRLNYNYIFISTLLIATFMIGGSGLIQPILTFLTAFDQYSVYAEVNVSDNSFSITRLALNFLVIGLLYLTDNKNIYIKLLVLAVVILNLFSPVPYIARFAQYLLLPQILLYPKIQLVRATKYGQLLRLVILLYGFFVYVFMLNNNTSEVVPYQFSF